ncbi:MAG: TonB-dependent receptor [Candidatus Solibacter sp.]
MSLTTCVCLALCGLPTIGWAGDIRVNGSVIDENRVAVPSARIRFIPDATETGDYLQTVTGPDGAFHVRLPAGGRWAMTVQCDGFFPLKKQKLEIRDNPQAVLLILNRWREVYQSTQVSTEADGIDPARTDSQETLKQSNLVNIPYSGRDLRGALKLMPGVLQDPKEGLHLSGSSPNQVLYTLDGFNITDPLTGRFTTRLNVDSVRSVEYSTGRFSPEFGKGSAGTVAISTGMGSDRIRYTATNFVPGIDTRSGPHIGTWAPRVGFSGPFVKGRAWFSESADAEYSQLLVEDIKDGQNRTASLRLNNLFHTQVNLKPSNLLFASFLMNSWNAPGWGLSVLDPPSATINRRSRTWFFSLKDQMYLGHNTVVEFGYAENRTFARQIPQGDRPYLITPSGRRGNYFEDSTRTATRKQWLASLYLPVFHWGGEHRLKTGIDLDRTGYMQNVRRTAFENYGLSGNLIRRTTFRGWGHLRRPGMEASAYLVDSWKVRQSLVLELGIRQDWDELIREAAFSPRFSFAWTPFGLRNTKLSGGFAVVFDATPIELFAQPLDQSPVNTSFRSDGSVESGPTATVFAIPNPDLRPPEYRNWTLGLEQRLPHGLLMGANGLRKRGRNGLTYVNAPSTAELNQSRFDLCNSRQDIYDSVAVTARQSIRGEYEWMASYTRSRSLSNAVLNMSADTTTQVNDNVGPMPWDSPNRLLAWGYFPTPWPKWSVAAMVEARDGFPFSILHDDGAIVGGVNSYRLPAYFSLDVHLERRLRMGKHQVALRGGFVNATNHQNPTVVNNIIGSPQFLQYFGSQGRHVIFRLRWLGKDGF